MSQIETDIDWLASELIEQIPVSGRPIVRGTRILPDPIVNSYELGDSIEEIHEDFPALSIAQIVQTSDVPRSVYGKLSGLGTL
jgi:uncharacterized protein (DUF433 family)